MARAKTKYREIKSPPAELISADAKELPPSVIAEPQGPVVAVAVEKPQAEQPQPVQDDAALALRRQMEALARSEAIQRQQAAQAVPQQPPTREQKLAHWQSQGGMSEAEAAFFEEQPGINRQSPTNRRCRCRGCTSWPSTRHRCSPDGNARNLPPASRKYEGASDGDK